MFINPVAGLQQAEKIFASDVSPVLIHAGVQTKVIGELVLGQEGRFSGSVLWTRAALGHLLLCLVVHCYMFFWTLFP